MAINETANINLNFESNADQTTQDVNKLSNAIDDTTQSTKQLEVAQDKLGSTMKTSGSAVLANGGAMGLLNDLTGGYAMMVKDAVEALELFKTSKKADTALTEANALATGGATVATEGLTIAQRALNLVLNANPYILIISLIAAVSGAMYGWFSITQKQKDALKESTNAINLNALSTENLKTNVERTKTETEASNTLEIARAKALGASEKEIQKLIQAQKDLAASTAITNASNARQQQIQAENNLRILRNKIGTGSSFFGGLTDEEQKQIDKAQEALKAATEFYTAQNAVVDSSINDAAVNRLNTQTENNTKFEEANKKHLAKLQKDQEQAFKDAIEARRKANERYQQDLEDGRNLVIEGQDKVNADVDKQKDKENKDSVDKFNKMKADADEEIAIRHAVKDAKKMIQEAEINAVEGAIHIASSLLSKTKDQQKAGLIADNALGIASIVINTMRANAAAPAKYALVPGGPLLAAGEVTANNINAGISIATSVAATAKGLIAIGAGGSPSTGNVPAASRSASQQPNVSFVASGENQIQQTLAATSANQKPIKTYVVASEVTTQQSLDANKIEATSI